MNAAKAASRMRSRNSLVIIVPIDGGTAWYQTAASLVPVGTTAKLKCPARTRGSSHASASLLLRQHYICIHRVGDRHDALSLAETPFAAAGRSAAADSHPAQLPLRRAGILGHRRRVARSAVCLRAACRLRGPCGCDTRAAV